MIMRLKNSYLWAYATAILLHIAILGLENPLGHIFLTAPPKVADAVSPPMIFEFVDVPTRKDDARPEETRLIAERDQIARDQQTEPLPEDHLPFSEGMARAKDMAMATQGHARNQARDADAAQELKAAEHPSFSFADVLQKSPDEARQERERVVLGGVMLPEQRVQQDNRQTRALERGGLQLSTYAWNYAPYLTYLKRRIEGNIFPPRAFDMGMLEGTTRAKFRIWRDGRLEGPELIDYKGSDLLRDTSLKAVELSARFKALPPDFPDEYLEIVGTFEYIILGKGPRRQ